MHVALLENGVMMVPLVYPSVKRGDERLRLNVTRGHTQEDMDKALVAARDLRSGLLRAGVISRRITASQVHQVQRAARRTGTPKAEASCTRCGDFVCRLCTPLEPVAMCNAAWCAPRSTGRSAARWVLCAPLVAR